MLLGDCRWRTIKLSIVASSPSFGSQQIRSCSNQLPKHGRPIVHPRRGSNPFLLSLRIIRFSTLLLAYLLDSLVRVSRRVDKNHLVSKKHPEGKGQIPPPRPVIYVRHSEESPPRSNHRKRSAAQSFPPFLYVVPQKLLSRNQKGAPKTRGCSVLPGPSFALRNDVDPGESII